MKHIYKQILEHLRSGSTLALATVTRTSGSTPQKPGSSALFGEYGLLAGTVGGGVLEGEVQKISQGVMVSKSSNQFYFDLNSKQGDEGSICGGQIAVLVDANPGAHLKELEKMEQSIGRGYPGILVTFFFDQEENGKSIQRYWVTEQENHLPIKEIVPLIQSAISELLKHPNSEDLLEIELPSSMNPGNMLVFLEPVYPLPRLVIAGAGHIGKALAHLASLLDFEVTVIDDRVEFANRDNIPDADQLVVKDFGQAMQDLPFGKDTYIVIVTRGHQNDAEALKSCVAREFAYIGMIGSANKIAVMRQRFLDEAWATEAQWERINTPVGIKIRSRTVQEIAISIAAQLVSIRNKQ